MAGTEVGSVGHLVGAALETVGQYLQAEILTEINGEYGKSLALLLYVGGMLVLLTRYAIEGDARKLLTILIGPGIFFLVTNATVDSTGAEWRFGSRTYPLQNVDDAVRGARGLTPLSPTKDDVKPVKVSWFYAIWNKTASGIIQSLIDIFQLPVARGDLAFVSKVERYQQLMNLQSDDPALYMFTQLAVVNECGPYLMLLQEFNNPNVNDIRRKSVEQELLKRGSDRVFTFSGYPSLEKWMASKPGTLQILQSVTNTTGLPLNDLLNRPLTCDEIWQIATALYKAKGTEMINVLVDESANSFLTAADIKAQLQEKFKYRVMVGQDVVEELSDADKAILMINEVSARMLLKDLKSLSPEIIGVDTSRHAYNPMEKTPVGASEAMGESLRRILDNDQYEEKGDYISAALSLPYVQGMMLYFLSALFPLFAFALLIPGHQKGFLTWMGLWIWAKSWDFGFAVVMVIDNLLYGLLPTGSPIGKAMLPDPGATIKTLLQVDPTYHVHTYYNILSGCLAAVPVLTGIAVSKGGKEAVDMVSSSLSNFAGRIGESMAAYGRALGSEAAIRRIGQLQVHRGMQALAKFQTDPVATALRTGAISKGLQAEIAGQGKIFGMIPGNQFLAAMNRVDEKQRMNMLQAYQKYTLSVAEYEASWSPYALDQSRGNLERASWSFTHGTAPPAQAIVDLMKEANTREMGAAANAYQNDRFESIAGWEIPGWIYGRMQTILSNEAAWDRPMNGPGQRASESDRPGSTPTPPPTPKYNRDKIH